MNSFLGIVLLNYCTCNCLIYVCFVWSFLDVCCCCLLLRKKNTANTAVENIVTNVFIIFCTNSESLWHFLCTETLTLSISSCYLGCLEGFNVLIFCYLGCLEGFDAQTVKGYVIHDQDTGDQIHIPYPTSADGHIYSGRSFHHGRFVMALRKAAQKEETVTMVEGNVTTLLTKAGRVVGVRYKDKTSKEMRQRYSPLTIVCDGCFSRFRKALVQSVVSTSSHFVGLIMVDCPQVRSHHAELVLGSCCPSLIYKTSSNESRVLVDIQGQLPSDLKGHLKNNVLPQFPSWYHTLLHLMS